MIKGGLGEYLTPCDKAAALRLTVTSMRHARALHACTGRMNWKGDGEKMTKL